MQQAILARQQAGRWRRNPADAARCLRRLAHLDFGRDVLDALLRDLRGTFGIHGGDRDRAIVLDVDTQPVSSVRARITAPPLPITSRIFSGLILMWIMRGAKVDTSSRCQTSRALHLAQNVQTSFLGLGQSAPA
jgi:hypothetical protein